MDNKMIEIRESFWDKFKSFFKKMFLRNKNAFSNEEQKTADEIDKIYYNGGKIEEDRIKDFEKTMDENLKLKDEEERVSKRDEENNAIDPDEAKSENEEERSVPKSKYQKTIVNGKEVRCREINDGEKNTLLLEKKNVFIQEQME